jgi:hypothetical protein
MAPDVALILVSTLLTVVGYVLWIVERLPRLRNVIGVMAVVTFLVAVAFHSTITSRQSSAADLLWGTQQSQPAGPDAETS